MDRLLGAVGSVSRPRSIVPSRIRKCEDDGVVDVLVDVVVWEVYVWGNLVELRLDDDALLTTKGNHGGYCEIKRVKDIKDTAEIIGALGGLEVDLVRLGNAPRRAPT